MVIGVIFISLTQSWPDFLVFSAVLYVFGFSYGRLVKPLTRYIPLFKNIFVATFWVVACLYILVFQESFDLTAELAIYLIYFFLIALNLQIAFDFKDVKSDANAGLKTLPVLVGVKLATKIIYSLSVVLVVTIVSGILLEVLSIEDLLLTLPLAFVLYSNYKAFTTKKREYAVMTAYVFGIIFLVSLVISWLR